MKNAIKCLLLLALTLLALPAGAVSFNETFEGWAWHPIPEGYGYCALGPDCFNVMGCGNGKPLFIRRVVHESNEICEYDHQVQQWTGVETLYHGNDTALNGTKMATFILNDQGPTLEMLTSRGVQASKYGTMSVDFYVHGDAMTGNQHIAIMHNLRLKEIPTCARDCSTVPYTRTTTTGGPGFDFYGVVAGVFGEGSSAIPRGSVGFAVEKACTINNGDFLVDSSFIPWNDGAGGFPGNTWYRVTISSFYSGIDWYRYTAYRRVGGSWVQIGSKLFARSLLACPGGEILPNGYVGLTGLVDPTVEEIHIDVDNFYVNW